MSSFDFKLKSSIESDRLDVYESFPISFTGFDGNFNGGSVLSQSLVLNTEKVEVVKAPVAVAKKERSEAQALAALKSHSDSERRRRERINAHLATLRGLVPQTEKMDKATLLAQTIGQVKEFKKKAGEASQGLIIPLDADEVRVEPCDDCNGDCPISFRASICCNYQPQLLCDLQQALGALQLKFVKAEISILEDRLKYTFVFGGNEKAKNIGEAKGVQVLARSVHQALCSILDKASAFPEYSSRTTFASKRRRISYFESSSSSS